MWRRGWNRCEVFQRAAALADTLEKLRLQVQNSLAQLDTTAGSASVCTAGRMLHTIDEAADDCASTGRASAASSVAPRQASSDEDTQDGVGASRGRLSGGPMLSSMALVKGIGVPLPRQASPDISAATSATLSAGPDLSSLPPRLQKIAQVCCRLARSEGFLQILVSFRAFHKGAFPA